MYHNIDCPCDECFHEFVKREAKQGPSFPMPEQVTIEVLREFETSWGKLQLIKGGKE